MLIMNENTNVETHEYQFHIIHNIKVMHHWDAGRMKGSEQFPNIKGLLKKMEVLSKAVSRLQKV